MANRYTDEQKSEALARVLAGEAVSHVAAAMGIGRTNIHKWLERDRETVNAVVTAVTTTPALKDLMIGLWAESMMMLTDHIRMYREPSWYRSQKTSALLETDRTVGSRLTALIDRLPGVTDGTAADTDG